MMNWAGSVRDGLYNSQQMQKRTCVASFAIRVNSGAQHRLVVILPDWNMPLLALLLAGGLSRI